MHSISTLRGIVTYHSTFLVQTQRLEEQKDWACPEPSDLDQILADWEISLSFWQQLNSSIQCWSAMQSDKTN